MKAVFVGLGLIAGVLFSCNSARDIQVERMNVQLIKIDTLYRQSGIQKVLTWETENRIRFTSFEPNESNLPVGTTMAMLIRR